jgi:predicted PurR-regulated permease PerM
MGPNCRPANESSSSFPRKLEKKGLRFLSFTIMTVFFFFFSRRAEPLGAATRDRYPRRRRRRRKRIFRFIRRNAGLTVTPAFFVAVLLLNFL